MTNINFLTSKGIKIARDVTRIMLFLSCVSRTALPVDGLVTLAVSCRALRYNTLLSSLLPDLLPNGRSETTTSAQLLRKGSRVASHWDMSDATESFFSKMLWSRLERLRLTARLSKSPPKWKQEENASDPCTREIQL